MKLPTALALLILAAGPACHASGWPGRASDRRKRGITTSQRPARWS